jgi:hypothetical protein
MFQFGAGLAATSNPFCVNSEGFLARNGEMPGDMQGLWGCGKRIGGTFSHSGTFCS